jgi:hypothetical protein
MFYEDKTMTKQTNIQFYIWLLSLSASFIVGMAAMCFHFGSSCAEITAKVAAHDAAISKASTTLEDHYTTNAEKIQAMQVMLTEVRTDVRYIRKGLEDHVTRDSKSITSTEPME